MKASAGSGKTYTLARKYISLLLESPDRYAYRHILAVTFTNKATDEMKSRILKELHVLATDPSASDYHDFFVPERIPTDSDLREKARAVLSDMLHDYSAFAVSTIDRFFQQTLKAFSREIGQFASYQVELDKDSLVAESVDRVLDSLTEEDSSLLSWLTENVLEQIEMGGRYSMDANLLDMAKRLKSVQRQEVMESCGMNDDKEYPKDELMKIREECRRIVASFTSAVRDKAAAALRIMTDAGVDPAESNRGFLKALDVYARLEDGDRVEAPTPSFMSKARDRGQWFARSKATTLLKKVSPFLEAPLEDFCELFGKDFKVYNTALILDNQLYGLGVSGELSRAFKELMKEKNVLCIDDSNTILRDIIDKSDAPFVYEKLGVRYEHFLLDEFQDTAGVQWSNFRALLRESDSNGRDNLIVGDVKQSIYRWRGSDWKLLDETVPAEFPDHEVKVLDTNYRSLANIVNFNNCFFASAAQILDAMDEAGDDGPMARIYSDVRQKVGKRSDAAGSVSLTFCERDKELFQVLDSVRNAVEHGAKLSEIAILVRSNAIGEAVASYLIDNGVAVITDDSLRVRSSVTVRRIVSLMSYVDNLQDTVNGYLAGTLDISVPDGSTSLMDLAETIFRNLKEKDEDGIWKGEVLHVQSFMDHLQDYVSTEGNSLRGFLKHWEEQNPSISSPSSGESVRVMTIHKSKGLDFPYVIIPFVENITLYKAGKYWCAPDLEGTSLSGVADGVYDVTLSKSSENTLFADDYAKESFLQQVDNINTIYVAMTRAALGMHLIAKTPSAKCLKAVEAGDVTQFSDFSQFLYWFASASCLGGDVPGNNELVPPFSVRRIAAEDGSEYFEVGEIVDFSAHRKSRTGEPDAFPICFGDELPSIPLNPVEDESGEDVRERGRLKFSADSIDFFSEDGHAGIAASNRIRGVVLHDVLSMMKVPEDLDKAVNAFVERGDLTMQEGAEVRSLLKERLARVSGRGWFNASDTEILNETSLIDSDGTICRPDRVVIRDGRVVIIDYKFGEYRPGYERQMKKYAGIWKSMGYEHVEAFLWYVQNGEVKEVAI